MVFGCVAQVQCGVDVPVVACAAFGAIPCAHAQCQVCVPVSAVVTELAGGVPSGYLSQCDTVFAAGVSDQFEEGRQSLFLQCGREVPVLHHAFHVQVFDGQRAWLSPRYLVAHLPHVFGSDVRQPLLDTAFSFYGLAVVMPAMFAVLSLVCASSACDASFDAAFALFQFSYAPGLVDVAEHGSIRENGKLLQSHVHAQRFPARGRGRWFVHVVQAADIVAAVHDAHGRAFRFAVGYVAFFLETHPPEFRQADAVTFGMDGPDHVIRVTVHALAFVPGEPALVGEEPPERLLGAHDRMLDRLAGCRSEPVGTVGVVDRFGERVPGQEHAGLMVIRPRAVEIPIVGEPDHAAVLAYEPSLPSCGVEFRAVGSHRPSPPSRSVSDRRCGWRTHG